LEVPTELLEADAHTTFVEAIDTSCQQAGFYQFEGLACERYSTFFVGGRRIASGEATLLGGY